MAGLTEEPQEDCVNPTPTPPPAVQIVLPQKASLALSPTGQRRLAVEPGGQAQLLSRTQCIGL